MKRLLTISVVFLVIVMFTSCNIGGFKDLGEKIDPGEPMGEDSTSYMRTEIMGNDKNVEVITIEDPDVENSGMIAIMHAMDDDDANEIAIVLTRATYIIEDPNITIYPYIEYAHAYKSNSSPASSPGASKKDFEEGTSETHSFSINDVDAELTYDTNTYKRMDHICDWIMSNSETQEQDMMRMYELTIIASQVKIDGFGGLGMFPYLNDPPIQFKGIRTGTFDLSVSGGLFEDVSTGFDYDKYSDHFYMILDGLQTSTSDSHGDGSMGGTVDATVSGTDSSSWNVNINYNSITLADTLPFGTYAVTIDSDSPVDVDAQIFRPGFFDFTGILDPDPESWNF